MVKVLTALPKENSFEQGADRDAYYIIFCCDNILQGKLGVIFGFVDRTAG